MARWFVDNETTQRRAGRIPLSTETSGEITFSAPGGDFTLNARADRIDRTPDGNLTIIDYKTGKYQPKHEDQLRQYEEILNRFETKVYKKYLVYIDNEIEVKNI